MTIAFAVLSGVTYGALHGLGPDHCAVVATFAARTGDAGQAALVGLRFGVSHAAVLGALTLASFSLELSIPVAFERIFEIVNGVLLITIGAHALGLKQRGSIESSSTSVRCQSKPPVQTRVSPFLERRTADFSSVRERALRHWLGGAHQITTMGGVFAASGARSLAIAVGPVLAGGGSWPSALAFVLAFGIGVTLAMVGCGLALAGLRIATPPSFRVGHTHWRWLFGAANVALGLWWVTANALASFSDA